MESKKNINGMDYVLAGDYYIPDLKLPNEERPIGKYGRMHLEYLKEHSPMRFNDLVLEGQLWTYLADLNEQTQERLSLIVEQMKVSEGVTEELKAADQMAWIRAMNSIHNRAEEIVLEASVYKGYKRDKIEMRGDRAEISDFPLYLNTVAGGLDRRDQTIGGFSFVVKIYALPVVEIIGQLLYLLGRYGFNAQFSDCL